MDLKRNNLVWIYESVIFEHILIIFQQRYPIIQINHDESNSWNDVKQLKVAKTFVYLSKLPLFWYLIYYDFQ